MYLIIFFRRRYVTEDFLVGVFSSPYYIGILLNTATLLITAGLGLCFSLKCGEYNLGSEGQIYFAGFISVLSLNAFSSLPTWIAFLITIIIVLTLTSAMAMLSAFLKIYKNANVLLTSFLISAATIPILDSLISGAFRAQEGNLLAMPFIKEQFRFAKLLNPSPLNISAILILPLCFASWHFLFRTTAGRHLSLWGKAHEFALYSGYSYSRALYSSLAFSGAMNGLTGFFYVVGTAYTCHAGFYVGLGWNALSSAMIAKSNPLILIFSSLLLAWLYTSVDRYALLNNTGFDLSGIIQGAIMFVIATTLIGKSFSLKKSKNKRGTK